MPGPQSICGVWKGFLIEEGVYNRASRSSIGGKGLPVKLRGYLFIIPLGPAGTPSLLIRSCPFCSLLHWINLKLSDVIFQNVMLVIFVGKKFQAPSLIGNFVGN